MPPEKELKMIFHIRIAGVLDQSWSDWLGNAKINSEPQENGTIVTMLTVSLKDQSALFGILDHIRDLNLILIDVSRDEEQIH